MTSKLTPLHSELEQLAHADAPLKELEAALQRQRPRLSGGEYDELWLFSWALVRRQPARLTDGLRKAWDRYDG